MESSLGYSNPPFLLTRTHNRLIDGSEISRGYIRRSDIDPADPTSNYRLYFMYNPSSIQRNYIAYLNQAALDPGNALFGSNNMASAPGIIDFSFSLLFDRHLEVAQSSSHPGTKVDYDYFDLVVRGVVPDGTGEGNAIPDNGIMMVNPNNITVVFGEDLTVHGRPYNASISFEKFNHRMVPTRMNIAIVMKAFYIGPVRTNYNFSTTQQELLASATIPYDKTAKVTTTSDAIYTNVTWTDTSTSAYKDVTTTSPSSGTTTTPTSGGTGDWIADVLTGVGAPNCDNNRTAMTAWQRAEGGYTNNTATYNWLNTTEVNIAGHTNNPINSYNVQAYETYEIGIAATVKTLTNGKYDAILGALRSCADPCTTAEAIVSSPWGTSSLIQTILGCGTSV